MGFRSANSKCKWIGFAANLRFDGMAAAFGDLVQRLRSGELEHGRFAMMAAIGYDWAAAHGLLPGYLSSPASLGSPGTLFGLGATAKVPSSGWIHILPFALMIEIAPGPNDIWQWRARLPVTTPRTTWAFSARRLRWEKQAIASSAELANDRSALAAISGGDDGDEDDHDDGDDEEDEEHDHQGEAPWLRSARLGSARSCWQPSLRP